MKQDAGYFHGEKERRFLRQQKTEQAEAKARRRPSVVVSFYSFSEDADNHGLIMECRIALAHIAHFASERRLFSISIESDKRGIAPHFLLNGPNLLSASIPKELVARDAVKDDYRLRRGSVHLRHGILRGFLRHLHRLFATADHQANLRTLRNLRRAGNRALLVHRDGVTDEEFLG